MKEMLKAKTIRLFIVLMLAISLIGAFLTK